MIMKFSSHIMINDVLYVLIEYRNKTSEITQPYILTIDAILKNEMRRHRTCPNKNKIVTSTKFTLLT